MASLPQPVKTTDLARRLKVDRSRAWQMMRDAADLGLVEMVGRQGGWRMA